MMRCAAGSWEGITVPSSEGRACCDVLLSGTTWLQYEHPDQATAMAKTQEQLREILTDDGRPLLTDRLLSRGGSSSYVLEELAEGCLDRFALPRGEAILPALTEAYWACDLRGDNAAAVLLGARFSAVRAELLELLSGSTAGTCPASRLRSSIVPLAYVPDAVRRSKSRSTSYTRLSRRHNDERTHELLGTSRQAVIFALQADNSVPVREFAQVAFDQLRFERLRIKAAAYFKRNVF